MTQDVNDGDAGQGETDGGSSPSKETMVPLSALLAERSAGQERLAAKVAELDGKLNAAVAKQPAPREYTRAELQQQVDDGRMTPDESDRIIQAQMTQTITAKVTKDLSASVAHDRAADKLQAEFDRYIAAKPDIMVEGSEARNLVEKELRRQTSDLGKPDNLATDVDVMMALYGPSNRLQSPKAKELETHQDVGGDGDGDDSSKSDLSKGLTKERRDHIDNGIRNNLYTGWDDPNLKTELEKHGGRWA